MNTRPPSALEANKGEQHQAGSREGYHLHHESHRAPPQSRGWFALALALAARAVVNPRIAIDLLALVWAFRRRDWSRRPPFLPVPSRPYMRWRMYTAYGAEDALPPVRDVLRFARWRRTLFRP